MVVESASRIPPSTSRFRIEKAPSFADRYLSLSRSQKQKVHLGQEKKRVEQITAGKALNLAQRDDKNILDEGREQVMSEPDQDMALDAIGQNGCIGP